MKPLLPIQLATLQARADARTAAPYWPFAPLTSMQLAQRAAWNAGELTGHRVGYVQGWRWGLVCGVCAAVAGGLLCCFAAWALGWL